MSSDEESEVQQQPLAGESEPEYEVDYIMKTKMHGRKRFFLVRWKGFGPEADSWEPIDMLTIGAKETVDEFMEKYNEERKNKAKKPRRATSKVVIDTDAIPPSSPSSDASSNEDEFAPGRATSRKRGATAKRAKKSAGSTSTPRGAASRPRAVKTASGRAPAISALGTTSGAAARNNVNRGSGSVTAWFMESSDSDDDRTAQTSAASSSAPQPLAANDILVPKISVSAAMATTPPDDLPGPSNALPGSLKMTFKRPEPASSSSFNPAAWQGPSNSTTAPIVNNLIPTALQNNHNGSDGEDAYRNDEVSPKKSKKDKKREKKHRKNKIQLEFVGCYRPAEDRPLSFVTRQIHPEVSGGDTRIYTLDEAIEIDSRSLSRYLSNFITFSPSGTPIVRPPRRSTSSSYNSD